MQRNDSGDPETIRDNPGPMVFFGFRPPATLHFDDSGTGGLKVKYARLKLPVGKSCPVADAPVETPRAAAMA